MRKLLAFACLLALSLIPPANALGFDLPPPPGHADEPGHGGPPQYDRPGPGEEAQDALDEASQQLPPSDMEQSGVDVVYYGTHSQGQGLGQVFGQFWNIGQDAMSTYVYSIQPGPTGVFLGSTVVAGGAALGQVMGQAGTMSAALHGLPSGYEAYVPRRWNWAGPQYAAGHDRAWGDDQFFSDCSRYWEGAGLDSQNIPGRFRARPGSGGRGRRGLFRGTGVGHAGRVRLCARLGL